MKRKAVITILSLVMCLTMAFPVNASQKIYEESMYKKNYDAYLSDINTIYKDYPYKALFISYGNSSGGIENLCVVGFTSFTPVVGSRVLFAYYRDGKRFVYHDGYFWKGDISYNNANGWPIRINFYNSSSLSSFNGISYSHYLSYLSNVDLFVDSNYFGFISGVVNSTALQTLLTQAKAKQNIGYTQSTWQALQTQISSAESVLANSSKTQSQVDNAKTALQAALDGLTLLPDVSELESLLSQAKAMQDIGYTQESWNELQYQVGASESVVANLNRTQSQVDNAMNALQSALNSLELLPPPLPDTIELEELLVEADEIEDIGYTVPTWTRFDNARISGHMLLARSDYTEPEVTATTVELRSSMDGLTLDVVIPPNPPAPLGYDLSTGDISGFLTVVPKIFYNYVVSAQPVLIGLFGIVLSILIIPRVLGVIIPHLRR